MTNYRRALIIIDMQKGMQSATLPRRNNPNAEAKIQQLLAHWRSASLPVVHVRHMSRSPGSVFWPGQVGADFQDALAPLASEHVLEKNVTDAFSNSGLERWLHVRGIKELVIVGVSTNNSVEATARSAGCLGFQTSVVSDATFTFDAPDLNGTIRAAEDIHLMSLSNLNGEYARVIEASELLG
ncbi:cysteine hydrolase family protein [Polaromonas sp. A23]|uniref:cysteine hydrolase family protein n=1 Tax=Polaromonas sp. A23 TaxID=1944133 RepID=UPI0009876B14|nr:cysteine hydrolase family protein [Polaromonas sp. A23]OOG37993.1 cysteine hydrolase [Polaromonas sp. A23]